MLRAKAAVRALLDQLPDDCTLDEVLYHLYVLQEVEHGRAEVAAGQTIPHEQVAREPAGEVAAPRRAVVWTDRARAYLDEAVAFVAQDSPAVALHLLDEALHAALSLETLSERGRVVPELGEADVREILVGRYRLMYEVAPDQVRILAFLHGARDVRRLRRRILGE